MARAAQVAQQNDLSTTAFKPITKYLSLQALGYRMAGEQEKRQKHYKSALNYYESYLKLNVREKEREAIYAQMLLLKLKLGKFNQVLENTFAFLKEAKDTKLRIRILTAMIKAAQAKKFHRSAIAMIERLENEPISLSARTRYRLELADEYEKIGYYSNSIDIHRGILSNSKIAHKYRQNSAVKVFELERDYGSDQSMEKALVMLENFHGLPSLKIRVLKFRTKMEMEKGHYGILKTHGIPLYSIAKKDKEAAQIYSGLNFQAANAMASGPIFDSMPDTFNIQHKGNLKEYLKLVKIYLAGFAKVSQAYDRACTFQSSYCGPAKFKICSFADNLIDKLNSVAIPSYFSNEEVIAFKSERHQGIQTLKRQIDSHYKVAKSLALAGKTSSGWSAEILGYQSAH